ncbi:cAMP-binding protein - catabolite gene activator and regulatory subunit of cAMP-dependent protein kinase [Hahella chejuensis KCTC 2396]|uniref:cAMP-binding protein-catabolite gene activator and regulatory subunit of cAMP-dependent protein kinase n=1 Tax=Hahella chejuensis (strain KCTC 2396) TaxID=349521 RepID=Q2S6T5_HAHCH|nr:cyclic nucleotide-binding domain-containing protein [Hahella chejuensis]ABC33639.1 cAMP-binding protein - catabolite gene activator and regulatory subunit of cAMP-dependent protein kinase [Hahella chejuensis KCTC 2396]
MSLHASLNITDQLMSRYSPLSQLSRKYLNQVIKRSKVMTFGGGEVVFDKSAKRTDTYYLLKGALKIKKNILSSTTIDSTDPDCLFPLNGKMPEGVTVTAQEPGHMLAVDGVFLDRALAWTEAEAKQDQEDEAAREQLQEEAEVVEEISGDFDEAYFDWMASLLEFPLFFNLPPANVEKVFARFERIEVKKGQVIIEEGDEGDYFYLLIDGSARVVIGGDESKPIRVSKGSYFGEEALVSDTVRSATIIMSEDGVLARLDKKSFQSLLHDPLVNYVSLAEFRKRAAEDSKSTLLDIRSTAEFEHSPLPKCLHVPLADLRDKISGLDKSAIYYLSQEGGRRNDVAAHILYQNGIQAFVIRDE